MLFENKDNPPSSSLFNLFVALLTFPQDEIDKASRILTSITAEPTDLGDLEDAGRGVMLDLLKDAVGLVFMTTIKVGGLLSGMGGTGILSKFKRKSSVEGEDEVEAANIPSLSLSQLPPLPAPPLPMMIILMHFFLA